MCIQPALVVAQFGIDDSEIEVDDEIFIVVGRGMLTNVQVAVEPFVLVGIIDVVVVVQHRHRETLAEAAWTDEEEELVGLLHLLNEPRLIDIVAVVFAYSHEIHHTVGYAFCLFLYHLFFHKPMFQISPQR